MDGKREGVRSPGARRVVRILGVDPGSRLTGFGCIDTDGRRISHIAHGTIRLARTGGRQDTPLEERLLSIYEELSKVIVETKPDVLVVEKVFFAKNAVSALKLGQARGAVILTGMIHRLAITEYSPSEVKSAVTGQGQADKTQVARMVQMILGVNFEGEEHDFETSDASDGLALAICHAQNSRGLVGRAQSPNAVVNTPGHALAAALQSAPGKRKKKKLSLAESLGFLPNGVKPVGGR